MVYTTEKLLGIFIDAGYRAIKKINKNTVEYDKLMKHIPTEINGKTYNCFRDYVNDKMIEYLSDNNIEAFINDNKQIELYLDDTKQQDINRKMFSFLKAQNII